MFQRTFSLMAAAAASLLIAGSAVAVPEMGGKSNDQVLAPYFQVLGQDAEGVLPLKSTGADVNISGVIAHVRVTQVYHNTGKKPIEAIYIFPGGTRAAVFGMQMTIGKRTVVAKINRREEARKLYEKARSEGKSASLLEQQRPNVFQMNVANIMPGDEIKVELDYSELLIPEDGFYEFVYPAVVGPRYSTKTANTAPASEHWVANPYLKKGQDPGYKWDISAKLTAGLPIQKISSPSHQVTPKFTGESTATVALGGNSPGIPHEGTFVGNRDFILRYRLAGGAIESGLILYPGKDENFFLAMVQPPKRVRKKDMPSREYVFILDISGSMSGFPLDISKKLMEDLLDDMQGGDTFNIMTFAGSNGLLNPTSIPATDKNIKDSLASIRQLRGGGGTQLLPALKRALTLPTGENTARTFVILTDGYINVEDECFELIRKNLGTASMFTFGIGSSVNRHLLEGMATVGMGEPFIVTSKAEAPATATKFAEYISAPVLTNVAVNFTGGFDAYDVEPKSIPDLLAQRPLLVFGKYKGKAKGKIEITGATGGGEFTETMNVKSYKGDDTNQALRYLWARWRIAEIADLNQARISPEEVEEVTNLGIKYALMTKYTSFVAIDSEVRNTTGDLVSVKQPLPLPAGVENSAVGRHGTSPPVSYKVSGTAGPKRDPRPMPTPLARAPRSYDRKKAKKRGGGYWGGGKSVASTSRSSGPAPEAAAADAPDSGGDVFADGDGTGTLAGAIGGEARRSEDDEAEEIVITGGVRREARKDKENKNEKTVVKPAVRVRVGTVKTDGVDTSSARKIVERAISDFRTCASGKSLKGKVTLRLVLDKSGRVTSVVIEKNSLGTKVLDACLKRTMSQLRFTAPSAKSTTYGVTVRLNFS